jgi:hypothetical protein
VITVLLVIAGGGEHLRRRIDTVLGALTSK